jgi:hypothetical protein
LWRAGKTKQLCDGLCVNGCRQSGKADHGNPCQNCTPELARRVVASIQADKLPHKILRAGKSCVLHRFFPG